LVADEDSESEGDAGGMDVRGGTKGGWAIDVAGEAVKPTAINIKRNRSMRVGDRNWVKVKSMACSKL
jgi:hypothetical protein